MTIKDYMRKVESEKMTPKDSAGASFTDAMMETTEIWSNDACVGYGRHRSLAWIRQTLERSWRRSIRLLMELPLMRQRIFTANTERLERLSEFYRKLVWARVNSN